jgi:cytochrome P450 family 6
MRLFPSIGILLRKTASKYTFPHSNLTIDEDVGVIICNHAMQMDEKYFEEPTKFKPERFDSESSRNIPNHVFLPFGEGPRACIGKVRFEISKLDLFVLQLAYHLPRQHYYSRFLVYMLGTALGIF